MNFHIPWFIFWPLQLHLLRWGVLFHGRSSATVHFSFDHVLLARGDRLSDDRRPLEWCESI